MTIETLRRALSCAAAFAVLSVALLGGLAGTAAAGDVTFAIKNSHPNAMRLELYSQGRDHVWPGGGKDYYLDDGETKMIPLSCQDGESICYGAWVDGDEDTYWGVGPGDKETCEDCCYVCQGGETEEIELTP
jgi:hypothetical protein